MGVPFIPVVFHWPVSEVTEQGRDWDDNIIETTSFFGTGERILLFQLVKTHCSRGNE